MNRYILRLLLKTIILALLLLLYRAHIDYPINEQALDAMSKAIRFLLFAFGLNVTLSLLLVIYRLRKKLKLNARDNITQGTNNLYILIIGFAFVLFVLSLWGIDFQTLFTSLSIVAAAIAIVSREFISSIIGGFVISLSRELNIGDYVKIGDYKGKVVDLKLTKVALLNEDDDLLYIPNDKANSLEIINYTQSDIRKISIGFEINWNFGSTLEEFEKNLIDELSEYHDKIVAGSFKLRIVEIKKDTVQFKFQYTLKEVNRSLEREIKRKTTRRVLENIKAAASSVAAQADS